MLISVITPVFNSERTIERNVRSVINQTYNQFEHIIIDNLSKDNTAGIIKKVYEGSGLLDKLKVFSERDSGITSAFNKGIRKANGEIIVILNSDDEYFHEKVFEEIVNAFMDEKKVIAYGNVYFYDQLYGTNIRTPIYSGINGVIQFIHPAMFFRRCVYDELGLYDEDYKFSMDFEFYCRLAKNYPDLKECSAYIKEKPLVKMNAGGASWQHEIKSIEEIKSALKKNGFWNFSGRKFYLLRKYRTILKSYFTKLRLNSLVKFWRRIKWKN